MFENIETGQKSVEARVAIPRYLKIEVGQNILFLCGRNSVTIKVTYKMTYKSFEDMLKVEGIQKCLPGVTGLKEAVEYYHNFKDYETLALQHGVVAFRLQAITVNSDRVESQLVQKPPRRYGEKVPHKQDKRKQNVRSVATNYCETIYIQCNVSSICNRLLVLTTISYGQSCPQLKL